MKFNLPQFCALIGNVEIALTELEIGCPDEALARETRCIRETYAQRRAALEQMQAAPVKILFLDIDGVCNRAGTRERSPHGTYGVEPALLALVAQIVKATGARIVISSTWRRYPDLLDYFWQQFGHPELNAGNTPILDRQVPSGLFAGVIRGDEIQAWLVDHPEVRRFVILDDDSDMGHLVAHLIKTNNFNGLTMEQADAAIRRLNSGS